MSKIYLDWKVIGVWTFAKTWCHGDS